MKDGSPVPQKFVNITEKENSIGITLRLLRFQAYLKDLKICNGNISADTCPEANLEVLVVASTIPEEGV